jgi:hypothetical protein
MNQQAWQNTLRTIFERSANDDLFRARCLTDPAGVVREISGGELPANFKFRFVEKLEETVLVLPPRRAAEGALSDQELEQIAGGTQFQAPETNTCLPRITCHN